jgi:DedD protein
MATRQSARTRPRTAGADDGASDPALPLKKRARHRLIGAIALCLLAAIVVPLLLESEPTRPVADVSMVIPSRDTPLPARGADASAAEVGAGQPQRADVKAPESRTPESKVAEVKAPDAKAADAKAADAKAADAKAGASRAADAKPPAAKTPDAKATEARNVDATSADAKAKAAPAKPPKSESRTERPDEIALLAETAQARARGETIGRYLLQVGAFSGEGGAAVAVDRVQALGLPVFTERIKTDRGERVRVRVGPFASRESAEQARVKLKAAGVDAALIAP